MITTDFTRSIPIGGNALPFSLRGTDGRDWTLDDFADAKVLVVFFTCNHCPYVVGWEGRVHDLVTRFITSGVRFVGINANDAVTYPTYSFEHMRRRAAEQHLPYPYVHDATQEVARAWGAQVTPEFYVFDAERTLRFHGRLDDRHDSAAGAGTPYLADAIAAVLDGRSPDTREVGVQGCSIKWS